MCQIFYKTNKHIHSISRFNLTAQVVHIKREYFKMHIYVSKIGWNQDGFAS